MGAPLLQPVVFRTMPDITDPHPRSGDATTPEDKLDILLVVIEKSRLSLENKIDVVAADLTLFHADHRKLSERVHKTEQSLAALQSQTHTVETQLTQFTEKICLLEERADDAEGQSRHKTIHVAGLLENTEGQEAVVYIEQWILEARKMADLTLNSARVMLFPGYTLAAQHQRGSLLSIKCHLDTKYSLLFPAKFSVQLDGKSYFTDPKEAWDWIDTLGTASQRPS
ncbi:hypothetical protein NDU88_008284 [Pleurodeles waltl]|uniref:Uncharacterized protein n=1 Tax=Pleurodeles waltl TaxID=8319 RepID=A0AAV7PRP8_PLEWA|nr:hypothetical protein NDU88_008284 [Pleurodeles waltl]